MFSNFLVEFKLCPTSTFLRVNLKMGGGGGNVNAYAVTYTCSPGIGVDNFIIRKH